MGVERILKFHRMVTRNHIYIFRKLYLYFQELYLYFKRTRLVTDECCSKTQVKMERET